MAVRRQAPTAPGTTVMTPSADKARRSRFWAVTYSSACQRVIKLTRLPTRALPATAPTSGSSNQRARRPMVSAGNWVSASSATTISPVASCRPRFSARALPPLGKRSSCTRGSRPNAASTAAAVPSVEPSSSTSTSSRFQLEFRMRCTEAATTLSSLKQGISTLTSAAPSVWASSEAWASWRSLRTRCSTANTARNTRRPEPSAMAVMNRVLMPRLKSRTMVKAARSSSSWPFSVRVGGMAWAGLTPASPTPWSGGSRALAADRSAPAGRRRFASGRRRCHASRTIWPPVSGLASCSRSSARCTISLASGRFQSSGSMRRPTDR